MAHISGFERDQLLLLPEAVDDYAGVDNPVRFIDAFVEGLDLSKAGFLRVRPEVMGRPGYAPGDLLKLYIYGYLNRVRSSLGAWKPKLIAISRSSGYCGHSPSCSRRSIDPRVITSWTTNHMSEKLSFPERAARLADTARHFVHSRHHRGGGRSHAGGK